MTLQLTSQITNPHLGCSSACGCSSRVSLLRGHPHQEHGWALWTGAGLCMTSLSLISGVILLGLWSAVAGALMGLFRQGPPCPAPAFPCWSVLRRLCAAPHSPYTDQGFSCHLVLLTRSQRRLFLQKMSAISKRCHPSGKSPEWVFCFQERLFPRLSQQRFPRGLPRQPALWNNPG